jgi:hypothetical protein
MAIASKESIRSFEELKSFVYQRICHDHHLLADAFSTTEKLLTRGNAELCGVMFCFHGPRAVAISAIWDKEQNHVLFYDSIGRRYHEIALLDAEFELRVVKRKKIT